MTLTIAQRKTNSRKSILYTESAMMTEMSFYKFSTNLDSLSCGGSVLKPSCKRVLLLLDEFNPY